MTEKLRKFMCSEDFHMCGADGGELAFKKGVIYEEREYDGNLRERDGFIYFTDEEETLHGLDSEHREGWMPVIPLLTSDGYQKDAVVVFCEEGLGFTLVDSDNTDFKRVCLNGPKSPYWHNTLEESYEETFAHGKKMIEDGFFDCKALRRTYFGGDISLTGGQVQCAVGG